MGTGIRMSRARGTVSGLLLVLLGAWGGLAPLAGPYFHFGFEPTVAWHYSMGRLLLSLIPGGVVVLTGLAVLITRSRWFGGLCAVIAALGGAWFVAGQTVLLILTSTTYTDGTPVATSPKLILLTNLACFAGTGALILFFAALALGRQSVAAHKDFVKFGDPALDTSAAGGLATVGLAAVGQPQAPSGYDPYQATTYSQQEYQQQEYPQQEYPQPEYQYSPTEFQPVSYQATEYNPTEYQPVASGSSDPATTSQSVVGGQAQFPNQYPDAFNRYSAFPSDPAAAESPASSSSPVTQPGPITYSAGQTQYPGATGPVNTEETNPITRPTTPGQ